MRNYVRKTNRGLVPLEMMQAAAIEVTEQGQTLRKVARDYNICHVTLSRFIQRLKSGANLTVGYNKRLLFTVKQEQEIAKHLVQCSKNFICLGIDAARTLAYQYVVKKKYNVPALWLENGTSGKEWMDKFLLRNPQVPVKTSKAMIDSEKNITEYFNMLHRLFEKYTFLASRIYHLVDINVRLLLKCRDKFGGTISTSGVQEKSVNVQLAANAFGEIIPPMLTLPIESGKFKNETQGFVFASNNSGQVTTKEFLIYLNHFIFHTEPSPSDPVLLLLDNHQYLIDLNVFEKAKANSIILLFFPKHCKAEHRIQPLKQIVKLLRDSCKSAQMERNRENSQKPVEVSEIAEIVGKVLPSEKEIKELFFKTGLWPFNPRIVTGEDFVPSVAEDNIFYELTEQDAPGPSGGEPPLPWTPQHSDTEMDSNESDPEDPLKKGVLLQCRCCGEFTKDSVDITINDKPYLSSNRTTIALNSLSLDLDFNNSTLPKTICKDCDVKLHDIYDFVNLVNSAQSKLIDIDHANDCETVKVKTEFDIDDENYANEIQNVDEKHEIEDIVNDNVFVNVFTHKRKHDSTDTTKKKAKIKAVTREENKSKVNKIATREMEFVIDVKDVQGGEDEDSEFSSGTCVNPGEDMAVSIISELAGDVTG